MAFSGVPLGRDRFRLGQHPARVRRLGGARGDLWLWSTAGFLRPGAVPARHARRPARPRPLAGAAGTTVARQRPRAHTGDMGRIIGTILGAILAIWLAFTAAGGIVATLKTFLIIGLIAMAVFIVVWLVAKRPRRG
jgi:hypothetical protein